MSAYEHELHILKQTGEDPRSQTMAEVEAGLTEIREALGVRG